MAKVGLLTVSDGRPAVHRDLALFVTDVEGKIAAALERSGHTVMRGEPIWTNELAVSEARRIADARPALTVINIPIWAFPHFTMRAARELPGPLLLFSNIDPQYPGMVGMLAAGGALDQIGRTYGRVWGNIAEPSVIERIDEQIRAGEAVRSLRGSTFGRIGGRPMGMYTAVANPDRWLAQFGVDVEEIDQWELVRRSDAVDAVRVSAARDWLERNAAGVHYDGKRVTPEVLGRQNPPHYTMRARIDRWRPDFS